MDSHNTVSTEFILFCPLLTQNKVVAQDCESVLTYPLCWVVSQLLAALTDFFSLQHAHVSAQAHAKAFPIPT